MKALLSFIMLCLSCSGFAGVRHLLPKPQNITVNGEKFYIDKVKLAADVMHDEWVEFIEAAGGRVDDSAGKKIKISIVDDLPEVPLNKDEAYRLWVASRRIEIQAASPTGLYRAMQTLDQLKTTDKNKSYFEGCEILDHPAFRIRGFMQDVGRTYISLDELKREVAKLASYKINVFHWHLTENQGWRLESKIFPALNDSVNFERMPGMFYTLDEARELVDFCKRHHVMLIPEIDMPGHSRAFEKTFGCDMQSPKGTEILKQLMDEVCRTFDVPYIHIGTDEVEFTNPDFVPEMVAHIRGKGKKVISWNPGWKYSPGEIDMTQLWSYRGRAQEGIPAIDSRLHYINHFDAFADIIALYNSRILDSQHGSDDIAGCVIGLWNDRYINSEDDILIQNNFYPAMLAMAERSWLGGGSEYFDVNGTVLPHRGDPVFESYRNFEERMLWHKANNFAGYPFAYVKQTNVNWRITEPFPNGGDLNAAFPPEKELSDSYQYNGRRYGTKDAIGAGIYLRHVWGSNTVKSFYDEPQPNHTAYAYTYVYSPRTQDAGLWISFQNYSRSEKDLPPRQSEWDYKCSRIWINDSEIHPPRWQSQHTVPSNEIPLTNENFEVREPLPVKLEKGWNKVLLKLPVGQFSTPEIRLVKWMFNCVFVTSDGNETIEGLIYSPVKSKEEVIPAVKENEMTMKIKRLSDYPIEGGVSAPFAGVHSGKLIVAGGCNFPDIPASEGGVKEFYDDIYYLDILSESECCGWIKGGSMPYMAAYGSQVATPDGMICIGGQNGQGTLSNVVRIRFDEKTGTICTDDLSALPEGIFNGGAAIIGNTIYLVGGVSSQNTFDHIFSLNLDDIAKGWQKAGTNQAQERQQPVVFSQGGELFMAGGYDERNAKVFTDVLKFDFSDNAWHMFSEIQPGEGTQSFIGAACVDTTSGNTLLAGGVDYQRFASALARIKRRGEAVAAGDDLTAESLAREGREYMSQPPEWYRFRTSLMSFDAKNAEWRSLGDFPQLARAGAAVVISEDNLYVICGEIKPGVRTAEVNKICLK